MTMRMTPVMIESKQIFGRVLNREQPPKLLTTKSGFNRKNQLHHFQIFLATFTNNMLEHKNITEKPVLLQLQLVSRRDLWVF